VLRLDRPSLPVFAIGAGAVHLIALALLLPLLITLPGPGSDAPPKPVNVEVDLGSRAEPAPIVPNLSASRPVPAEETSALPAASEAGGETPDALADVSPETEPSTEGEPEAGPVKVKPLTKPAITQKAKPKIQAKAAKPAPKAVRQSPQRKTLFARGRSPKPLFGGGTARSKAQGPSWSALLNAAPSAADGKR
jgi:hypothetical protein